MISVSLSQGSHYQLVCHLSPVFITPVVSVVVVILWCKTNITKQRSKVSSRSSTHSLPEGHVCSNPHQEGWSFYKTAKLLWCHSPKIWKEEKRQSEKHIHVARAKHMQAEREKHKRMLRKWQQKGQDRWANIAAVKWFNNMRNMITVVFFNAG